MAKNHEAKISELTRLLVKHPNLRERKSKNKLCAKLVQLKYPYELKDISLDRLADIFIDNRSYFRAWNKVTQDNPHLRGTDYDDKEALEQEAELDLGYRPGYENDTARRTKRKIGDDSDAPKVSEPKRVI